MIKSLFRIRSERRNDGRSLSTLLLFFASFLMVAEANLFAQRPGGGEYGGGRSGEYGERRPGGDGERRPGGDGERRPGGDGGGRTFGGGGPRGFIGGGGGTIFTLMNEDAQKDLGLTAADLEKVRAIQEQMRPDPSMFEKMRNAQTDEEREAARTEMQTMFEKRNQESEKEIEKLIGNEKMARLKQINLQFQGPRALQDETVAKDLNLTSDQQSKIEALNEQRNDARRELGFRASAEERAAFDAEWNKKIFAVLTPDQSKAWEGKIGNVIVRSAIPGGGGPQFIGQSNSRFSASQNLITTDIGSQTIRPDGESEEVISSFGLIAQNTPAFSNLVNKAEAEASNDANKAEPAPAVEQNDAKKPEIIGFGELSQASTQKVSFNFRYAPWADILKDFARLAGLTLDLTTTVPGTFNYLDNGQYTPLEALDIINGYLIQKGYILVRRNQFLVVLNMDNGIPPNLIPLVTPQEVQKRGRNEIMKVRIPLKGISVDEAARTVEALLGPQGQIVPLSSAKELLVTDIGDNLRAISQLIDSIDKEDPNEVIQQTFKIEFVSVTEVETHVRDLLGLPRGVANVAAFTGSDRDRRSSSQAVAASASGGTTVIAYGKTNSLIVQTTRAQMKFVESLIKVIDVGDQRFAGGSVDTTPYLKVYIIQNAQADEIAKSLSSLYPGLVVNEDGRARKLHIVATEEEHARIGADIKEMDRTDGDGAVLVFYLNKLDPIGAASTLNSLFIIDGANAPVIEPDTFSRLLLIRGTYEHIQQIKLVLNQLGESGEMGQQDTGR
ncbi:MAG TPA: secretin N-terminal domain-containing protein, partial [Planctomycetaceae bacterium]|nr:secretin N-terminal domain-containing protein [Planctomycetaceae bacterium]